MVKKSIRLKKEKDSIAAKRSIILGVIMFSGWLFFWPLVECWYGQGLSPLIDNQFKLASFIIGGLVFWSANYFSFRKGVFGGIVV